MMLKTHLHGRLRLSWHAPSLCIFNPIVMCLLLAVLQVELEIMLPEDMSVKESHDIALMLQHKVAVLKPNAAMSPWPPFSQTGHAL